VTIKRFTAQGFRCLDNVGFEPDPDYTLVYGANASGKTSLLEAIAYLGRGKSFRGAPPTSLIQHGEQAFVLFAQVESGGRISGVGVRNSRAGLEVKVDGVSNGGAAALAAAFRITPLVIGLTVVAFGTSAPELGVSLQAALTDKADVAIGNVVGSNIANVLLILGLAALIRPIEVHARVLRVDVPLVIVCSLLLLAFLGDGRPSRPEAAFLVTGLVLFTALNLKLSKAEPAENLGQALRPRGRLISDVALVLGGLGGLTIGADLFVDGAVELASTLGASEALIGLTIVSVGTSLPELATSVLAARRGQGDIALGNVLGSNVFNILGILGATGLVEPLIPGGVGMLDLLVALGAALVLLPFAASARRLERWEALLLLLGYGAYVVLRAAALEGPAA